MAFEFPWSNLHELNLDWILDVVKNLKESNDEFNEKADYAVETADEAKTIAEQAAQAVIPDGSITTAKLATFAVTTDKLGTAAVTTDKILDGTIQNNDIKDNAINTAKIADGAVTPAKLSEPVPLLKGGTGATTAEGAKINLGLASLSLNTYSAAGSSSIDIPFNNGSKGFFFTLGGPNESKGLFIFYVTGSGVVSYVTIGTSPANVTMTVTTNQITFSNASNAYLFVDVFTF